MTEPEAWAEDLPGLDELPESVRRYLAEQRQFWRQVRGDDGPRREAALRTGYADWVDLPPEPEAEDPEAED